MRYPSRMRAVLVLVLATLAAMTACKGQSETPAPASADAAPSSFVVDVTGFERACQTKDDCQIVKAAPCDKCGCPATPIAKSESARFGAAAQKIDCSKAPKDTRRCGECRGFVAECEAGRCIAKPEP